MSSGQNYKACHMSECENPMLFYCKPCKQGLCEFCVANHLQSMHTTDHDIVDYRDRRGAKTSRKFCQNHTENYCEKFCLTCNIPLCHSCLHRHISHAKIERGEAIMNKIEEISKKRQHFNILLRDYQKKHNVFKGISNSQNCFYEEFDKDLTALEEKWLKEIKDAFSSLRLGLRILWKKRQAYAFTVTESIRRRHRQVYNFMKELDDYIKDPTMLQNLHFQLQNATFSDDFYCEYPVTSVSFYKPLKELRFSFTRLIHGLEMLRNSVINCNGSEIIHNTEGGRQDFYVPSIVHTTKRMTDICCTPKIEIVAFQYMETDSHGRIVKLYTADTCNTLKKMVYFNRESRTHPLLREPRELFFFKHEDFSVVEWKGKKVVVFEEAGFIRFVYTGHFVYDEEYFFFPRSIAQSRKKHIIISEVYGRKVHEISEFRRVGHW